MNRETSAETGPSVCIVGGGVLGLTLALRLAQEGRRVTVLEASENLGGLADAWQVGDLQWDRHYHVTLLSDLYLRDLLAELGLADQLCWTTTKTDFFTDKQFYPLTNSLDYLRFPPLGLIDKMRLAGTIFYASRLNDGLPLEKIPLADWLTKLSGKNTYEQIWLPLLRAKLGDNHEKASAAFIWAIIRRLYAARRSGLKTEMFGYVKGGYARVFDRFAQVLEKAGVTLQTACPVKSVRRDGGRQLVETTAGTQSYDQVIVTTAAPLAARLCQDLKAQEKARLNGILYQGIICASVVLKQPLNGCYITYIADPQIPYTAVIEMSALVDRAEFGGHSLAYLPHYVASDDPAFNQSDGEIEQRFTQALMGMYPKLSRDDILAFRVSRVRQVLAVSTVDYSQNLPPMTTSVPGLHIVNSAHIVNGTLNVNETIKLAEEALPILTAYCCDGNEAKTVGGKEKAA